MFIQAQEETELNVKKQSGAAVGADSSWFPGVRQVGWPWRIQPMAEELTPQIDSFRLICQQTGKCRIFKHWHKCGHGQQVPKLLWRHCPRWEKIKCETIAIERNWATLHGGKQRTQLNMNLSYSLKKYSQFKVQHKVILKGGWLWFPLF